MMLRFAPALALVLVLAPGCAAPAVPRLADDPDVKRSSAAAAARPPAAARIAFAPIEAPYPLEQTAREWAPAPLDREKLRARLVAALTLNARLGDVDPLDAEDPFAGALARGDDALLRVTVREFRHEFRGRNAAFWPNLLLWYALWAPALYVRDEDYGARIEAEAALYDVRSEREIARVPLSADVERPLDDFERGFDIFGFVRLPNGLEPDNWARIGESLEPYAFAALERALVIAANDKLAPALGARAGTTFALVIDIAKYRAAPAISSSPSCAGDGLRVEEALLSSARLPAKNVLRLSGPRATREAIEAAARDFLARHAGPRDTALLYFSGAGTGGEILPYDAEPGKAGLALARLGEILRSSPAGRVLIACDARDPAGAGAGGSVLASAGTPAADPWPALAAALPEREVALLTAGDAAQDLAGSGNGLFTYYFLAALRGEADRDRDGATSLEEAFAFIADRVSMQARLDGRAQAPRLEASKSAGWRPWLAGAGAAVRR